MSYFMVSVAHGCKPWRISESYQGFLQMLELSSIWLSLLRISLLLRFLHHSQSCKYLENWC